MRFFSKVNASHFFAAALVLALTGLPVIAEDARLEPDEGLRDAVKKSLTYLADGGRDWMEGRNCASCHHAPMTIWSLNHAKQRGFKIDDQTLAEVTTWTLDPKVDLMPQPSAVKAKAPAGHAATTADDAKAKKDAEAQAARELEEQVMETRVMSVLAYYALATNHADVSPMPPDMRAKIIQHFLEKQEPDGSWQSYVVHPPIAAEPESTTLHVLLACLGRDGNAEPAMPEFSERKARALAYLAKAKPNDELQPRLWRLLLRQLLEGQPDPAATLGGSMEADAAAVFAQQHPDGGWGQTPSLPSDAYATGQVLYFLDAAGCEIAAESRQKAVAFLLKTQKPDGSWPMSSRNRLLPKPGPGAKNVEIIGYMGTAWAAMGLVSVAGR